MCSTPKAEDKGLPLLEIEELRIEFGTFEGVSHVLDGVSLSLERRGTLGLVGETGCGKSITAKAILRLLPEPPAKIVSGSIRFQGEDLLRKGKQDMRKVRGRKIAMVFQDPMTFLNPVFTIEQQLVDVIVAHDEGRQGGRPVSRKEAREKAVALLRDVRIPQPEERIRAYPHEFSGGMRQRVLIAMALSGSPDLLIADEPTTALDVTIQAQILKLTRDLVRERELSVLLISHDLGVVASVCRQIAVMYAGTVVENCSTKQLFRNPIHPYTQGLLSSILTFSTRKARPEGIKGAIPDLIHPPAGCRFHPRCPKAHELCRREKPEAVQIEKGHWVRCHLHSGLSKNG